MRIIKIYIIFFTFSLFFNKGAISAIAQNGKTHITHLETIHPQDSRPLKSLKTAKRWFESKNYEKSLKIALKLENSLKNNPRLYAENLLLLAKIFEKTQNYDESISYYRRIINSPAIDSSELLNYKLDLVRLFHYNLQKDSAITYQWELLHQIPDDEKPEWVKLKASSYLNLSAFYLDDPDKSYKYSQKALEYFKKINDSLKISYAYNNIASYHILNKNYKTAKKYLLLSLDYLKKHKNAGQELADVYFNLAWVMYLLKDYRSFDYAERSFDLRDSLNNVEVSEAINRIEKQFNVEKERKTGELKTARERAKRMKAQLYSIIFGILLVMVLLGTWVTYRFFRLNEKRKLEQIEKENQEKILNATLDTKENERKMIAEKLHHSLTAQLASANLHLEAAKMQLPKPPPKEIDKSMQIIKDAAIEIRNLSHSLMSNTLNRYGLEHAIQELAEIHTNQQLNIQTFCDQIKRYTEEFELRIYHIVTELLNNVIKHSNATFAHIIVRESPYYFIIKVWDNGKGFELKNPYHSGLGLGQIKSRVSQMKGNFIINTKPSHGTEVFIQIPKNQIPKRKKKSQYETS